jgi:hypothetical protein
MFCDICILFFELSFLGLGPELETKQAPKALALLCPFNLARKDKEWTKVGSKWKCKVGICTIAKAFSIGAWLGGRKVQTWEAFNCCRRSSTSRPCQDERSHLGKCHGCSKVK